MTTDKDIKKVLEIVREYYGFPNDDSCAETFATMPDCVPKSFTKDITQALSEERQRVLDLVLPVLEFYAESTSWTNGDERKQYLFAQVGESDWSKSVSDGFVGGKRARELLEKLRGLG